MTYRQDEAGRYSFPMQSTDVTRVVADCSCGWGMDGPERVFDWLSDRHAYAHNKGIDGLSPTGSMEVQRTSAEAVELEAEAEAAL